MSRHKENIQLSRRDRERYARIDLICRAATRVFSQKGFTRTTMEQVAKEAELGKSSLYYYFKTKQELFAHIISRALDNLARNTIDIEKEHQDPFEIIAGYCRRSLKTLKENREILVLLTHLMGKAPSELEVMVGKSVVQKIFQTHQPMFEHLSSVAENLPGGEQIARLISSLILGMATKMVHDPGINLNQELELFITILKLSVETNKK